MPLRRHLAMLHAMLSRSRRIAPWPVAIGCLVAACGGGDLVLPGGGEASVIEVVDGNGQTGVVGQALSAPVVVEVKDAAGGLVEGATVEFALTSAGDGGQIAPATAQTGADGRAEAQVLLGDKVGIQTGEARLVRDGNAAATATFSAAAMADGNRPTPASTGSATRSPAGSPTAAPMTTAR